MYFLLNMGFDTFIIIKCVKFCLIIIIFSVVCITCAPHKSSGHCALFTLRLCTRCRTTFHEGNWFILEKAVALPPKP